MTFVVQYFEMIFLTLLFIVMKEIADLYVPPPPHTHPLTDAGHRKEGKGLVSQQILSQ